MLWTQRCTRLKHVILGKTGAAESSRCIMQGLLSPRQMLNPAPQLNNNLRQLPLAVSLERRSHGVTQSKMLTNFHTLRHENKGRLALVHYPSKLSKPIYNILTKEMSTITKYKTQNPTTSIFRCIHQQMHFILKYQVSNCKYWCYLYCIPRIYIIFQLQINRFAEPDAFGSQISIQHFCVHIQCAQWHIE